MHCAFDCRALRGRPLHACTMLTATCMPGTWRKSPITGEPELHFAKWRRWLRYTLSSFVSGTLLLVAFAAMIASLNLQACLCSLQPL
jgi:hypothetical protein